MMLSINKPELCREILQFPGGIHCVRLRGESTSRIILKLPVSYLLPAKVNQGFKIYAVPVELGDSSSLGLMCAFFDDPDNPLVSWRLLDGDKDSLDLVHTLTRQEILVHLFDDQNRELLGYRARVDTPLMSKVRLEHAQYPGFNHDSCHAAHEQALKWFGLRNSEDDADAICVHFREPLFPEELVISDLRPDLYQFHGGKGHGATLLERAEPGLYQELDIILLLQNIFRPEQIFHAPKRHYDKEEIADIVVITDDICLIIQAKDSPNTEKTLGRTLDRKKLVSLSQLKDALSQVAGAIGYIRRTRPLRMLVSEDEFVIDLGDRSILSLVVIRELFVDTYTEYSEALFNSFQNTSLPCIALDYSELQKYTAFCIGEEGFLSAYFQVFNTAREVGMFPRLRFGVNDVEALWRNQE